MYNWFLELYEIRKNIKIKTRLQYISIKVRFHRNLTLTDHSAGPFIRRNHIVYCVVTAGGEGQNVSIALSISWTSIQVQGNQFCWPFISFLLIYNARTMRQWSTIVNLWITIYDNQIRSSIYNAQLPIHDLRYMIIYRRLAADDLQAIIFLRYSIDNLWSIRAIRSSICDAQSTIYALRSTN